MYLDNRLSYDHDIWHLDSAHGVDDLINFW